ncbi:hypothetical protein Taro_025696 [Colocasia esculenta]|uniref:Uncharacterized protein n=1 Tax=Colocasia esculenta TaxID=4460 RepID=A0A843V9I8_COLES|nr:hypothetical protein [Colocasia esculenta]
MPVVRRSFSHGCSVSLVGTPVPTALAGKGLAIPTEPCLRGSPPYSLQVGTRCRRSSLSNGRGGSLLRCALPSV